MKAFFSRFLRGSRLSTFKGYSSIFMKSTAFSIMSLFSLNVVSQEISDKIKDLNMSSHPQVNANFQKDVLIFSGNANPQLAQEIADNLHIPLGNLHVSRFADGEVNIQVYDNVRGKDIYIIQPTSPPVNENLMELLLLVSTLRRASARNIHVVIPYYGYGRQDRKVAPRVPISAADVARLLETVGVDRVISVDLHCGQIQGFFGPRVPVDNLEASIVALEYFLRKKEELNNTVIVSPDAGGVARAKKFQELLRYYGNLDPGLAMIIKHREMPGKVAKMFLVGDVKDKNVIIIDDMIDTAGTLCEAVKELKNFGAKSVIAFATHGLFSDPAFERINQSSVDKIVTTNTIPKRAHEETTDKIVRLSVAPLLAETIRRIQENESVSRLFKSHK